MVVSMKGKEYVDEKLFGGVGDFSKTGAQY
jgi:hypothetical protein